MNFRSDINGLRAIAVIAVVIFHFTPSIVPGGFAGVDIFFVISGYLMTGIILKGLDKNSFNLLSFYVARANRIIPSLAVVCFALIIMGWFYLAPMDYRMLAKHVTGSLSFISNIIYWREAGYFDAASREKWLLHTWSLSVEWQFYIIYPIILLLAYKFISSDKIKKLLIVGTVIGFALSIFITAKWPTFAYYMLPTRAWELMFGGLAYTFPNMLQNRHKKFAELVGLALILLSYGLITSAELWPGYLAAVPVVGTYLVLLANRQHSLLTDNIVFRYIGKWSYSIYLWHWPVVVLGYYFNFAHWMLIGIPLSLVLGCLNYYIIERIRFKSFSRWRELLQVKPIYPVLLLVCVGSVIFALRGQNELTLFMTANQKQDYLSLQQKIVMPYRGNGYCFYDFNSDKTLSVNEKQATQCVLGDKSQTPDTLLFGSSFAGMYDPFLDNVFKENHKSYNSVSTNWCSPTMGAEFTGPKTDIAYSQCLKNRQYLQEVIDHKEYKNIILADEWDVVIAQGFMPDVESVIKDANEKGINIILLPIPKQYSPDPIQLYYRQFLRGEKVDLSQNAVPPSKNSVNQFMSTMANKYINVFFIPRNSIFDKSGLFHLEDINIMAPYTFDGAHISLLGSRYASEHFLKSEYYKDTFRKIINPSHS